MNARQLGQVGIVLLGLWVLLNAAQLMFTSVLPLTLGLINDPWYSGFSDLFIVTLVSLALLAMILGAPAFWLIRNRTRLAETWFGNLGEGHLDEPLTPRALLNVGLLFLAISMLLYGFLTMLTGGVQYLFYGYGPSGDYIDPSQAEFTRFFRSSLFSGALQMVVGALLLRFRCRLLRALLAD